MTGALTPAVFRTVEERGPLAPPPDELYLEVTNRCNLRCRTCPQYFGMAEPFHTLEWPRFRAITDQFPVLRRVMLHGIGEPLLNPDLGRMIRHLKERGAYVLFNTNGLLLRGRRAGDLAASGLDELRVSIDGGTAATYRTVRGVDGFDRILANLRRFAALKADLGLERPRVSLWVTGMKATVRDLPDLVRVAAASGVPEVYLQRLVHSDRGLATRTQAIYGAADEEDRAAVALAERLGADLGVTLRGSGELGPSALVDQPAAGDAPWRGCHRPWRLTYVTVNGNALPCCIAPFTDAPYARAVMGNLGRQTLAEVWNGERYQQWRATMLDGAPPPACRACGAEWSL
ncbi:MAG: radical SAM/SPASM domain-containing protein [Dehalococcoidia bacterium]